MATVALSTSPVQIDAGSSYSVLVANTGSSPVELSRGGRLRPGQTQTVYPEGTALTAVSLSGAGQITTTTVAGKPLPNPSDPSTLATDPAFTATYAISKQGIYVPAGWGSFWKSARDTAKAGSGLARVACVGDSLTAGQWSSDFAIKNWVGLLGTDIQAAYGDGGSGYFSSYRTTLSGFTTQGGLAALTGTWAINAAACEGPGGSVIKANTAGATATFTVRGTTVDVFVLTGNGTTFGQYTVSIDGGTATSAVSTNTGTAGIATRTFTGLSSGTHTVTVTATDANGSTVFLYLCGVSARNATGLVVDNYGRGGWPALAFSNLTAQSWTISGTTYGGAANGTFAPAGKWSGGSSRPADLVIYSLGLNDAHYTLTAPDTFIRHVRLYLDDVKNTNNGAQDVMLLVQHLGTFDDATTNYYANYAERLRGVAEVYGAAFVNLWQIGRNSWNYWNSLGYWGNSSTPGPAGTDSVHLSDAGHAAVEAVVRPLLTA